MEEIKVLIVEDDFHVATIHQRFTERVEGFRVVGIAQTGADALAMVSKRKPELVVLDVYLPDTPGIDVLREIRARGHSVDVILITAAKDAEVVQEALRGGALDYIIKPFRFERYAATLDSYRRYRESLASGREVPQAELDRFSHLAAFPLRSSDPEASLPKGIDSVTLDKVVSVLSSARKPVTASEVGARLGVSRITARRYLEHLVSEQRAKVEPRYGTVGRPEHRYSPA